MTFLSNRDYFTEVQQGNMPKFSGVVVHGSTTVAQNAWQPVWDDTSAMDFDLKDTEPTVKVASTNANDTGGGSGAISVIVSGINSGNVATSEQLTLNGQTAVTTTNNWPAIHSVQVEQAGVGLFNAGDIWVGNGTFTAGVPANKYVKMPIGLNKSDTFIYSLLPTEQATLVGLIVGAGSGNFRFRLRHKLPTNLIDPVVGDGIWFRDIVYTVGPGHTYIQPKFIPTWGPGTIISAEVLSETGTNQDFSLSAEILVEDIS